MTGKADFTEDEWKLLLEGPPSAGVIVVSAQRGGTFREAFAIGKAYTEARKQHGDSELLDELVAAKPERDHTKARSFDELKENSLRLLGEIVELLTAKATPEEVDDYRGFVLTLADRVAKRHKEDGVQVSPAEQQVIDDVRAALG